MTVHVLIKGKVQGVFYRQSTKEKAKSIGIGGTVKNEEDGSVHIIATGSKEQLDELVQWCQRGPAKAKVEKVEVNVLPLESFSSFTIDR